MSHTEFMKKLKDGGKETSLRNLKHIEQTYRKK